MTSPENDGICCKMRSRFLVGITGLNPEENDPIEIMDFVVEYCPEGKPVLGIKFCPFCGERVSYAYLRRPLI